MAMSLMGGALIVISASDHQSNNISDEYQQTFYVAETALFEGEKYVINQFLGLTKAMDQEIQQKEDCYQIMLKMMVLQSTYLKMLFQVPQIYNLALIVFKI